MSSPLGKQVMRGLGFAAGTIIAVAVIGIAVVIIRTPSRAEELEGFLGPGEIVESVSGRVGLDSHYWARYRCDPEAVRRHIERHTFPSRASDDRVPQPLEERFLNPGFRWPANMAVFSEDWIEYQTGTGNYVIVAFPDDATQEVFYLEWDN